MKIKKGEISLFLAFATILFWDLIEKYLPNFQFVILSVLLLLNVGKIKKYINKRFLIVSSIILFHGIINILLKNDSLQIFFVQYGSIFVSYLSFSCIIDRFDSQRVFLFYWKSAVILSIIGCLEIIYSILGNSGVVKIPFLFINTSFSNRVMGVLPRIASWCNEPSFLGYFLAPAVFLIIYSMVNRKSQYINFGKVRYIESGCILLVYIMTFSTISYLGLIIMFVLIWLDKGISLKKLILPFLAVLCMLILYNSVNDFKMRVDDTYSIFSNGVTDSGSVNLSSYTFYANYRVTIASIKNTYGLGTGLGSYRFLFDKYNIGNWGNSGLNLNREDGNSLVFRVGVELGICGWLAIAFFLIKYFPKNKRKRVYSLSLLTLFFMIFLRMGNYTHGGFLLYVALYMKIWCESRTDRFIEVDYEMERKN